MKVLIELNKKLKARNHFLERENNVCAIFYTYLRYSYAQARYEIPYIFSDNKNPNNLYNNIYIR